MWPKIDHLDIEEGSEALAVEDRVVSLHGHALLPPEHGFVLRYTYPLNEPKRWPFSFQ